MSAIDIEALLVWTYRDQQADRACRQDWSLGYARDCLARYADRGGHGDGVLAAVGLGEAVHPDAEAVHAAVLRLSGEERALVIGHARVAARPDWLPGARLVWVPVPRRRGRSVKVTDAAGAVQSWTTTAGTAAAIYDANRNVIGHWVRPAVELAGGAVMEGWGLREVADRRRGYAVWHGALVVLAAGLRGRVGRRVSGPAAAAEPWDAGATTFALDRSITKSY